MHLEPVLNRIVVKVAEVKEVRTNSGIIIPNTIKENLENRRDLGVIVDMGPQAFEEWGGPSSVSKGGLAIGDKVLFARQGGKSVEDDDGQISLYRVLNDQDVICKIVEEDA